MKFIRSLLVAALIILPVAAHAIDLSNPEELSNFTLLGSEVPELNDSEELGPFMVSIPISWLLSFNLDGIATVPDDGSKDVSVEGTSPTSAVIYDAALGKKIADPPVPAGVAVSESMRISYDPDEGATLGSEAWTGADTFGTGWSDTGGGTFTAASSPSTAKIQDTNVITGGGVVLVTFNVDSISSGGFRAKEGTATKTTTGPYSEVITVTSDHAIIEAVGTTSGVISNVSFKLITPTWKNDTAKDSGIKLHPTKQLTENGVTSTVFLLYDYRQDSEVVSIGDHRYIVGTDNHNYSLTCSTAGTTHSSPPNVDTADIGSTVAEGGGTVVWDVDHYYSNLAGTTAATNYLPHILSEPAATNLALQSQDFGTTWNPSESSVSPNNAVAPDGLTTADKLTESINVAGHKISQIIGVANATQYVASVYAKAAERTEIMVNLASDGWPSGVFAYFDLSDGSVLSTGGAEDDAFVIPMNDGWYRCVVIGTTNSATGTLNIFLSSGGTNSYDGNGTSGAYLWQFDLVAASAVSTPIPTTTGTSTRAATSFTVPNPLPVNDFAIRFRASSNDFSAAPYFFRDNDFGLNFSSAALRDREGNSVSWTPVDGEIYNIGYVKSSILGVILYLDSVASVTGASDTGDLSLLGTLRIGSNTITANILNGGITDLQLYTGSDLETWASDVDWDDAVNYLNDYIQYHGRLIPADIDISYDQPYEEAA